jgi:hypothetical protein
MYVKVVRCHSSVVETTPRMLISLSARIAHTIAYRGVSFTGLSNNRNLTTKNLRAGGEWSVFFGNCDGGSRVERNARRKTHSGYQMILEHKRASEPVTDSIASAGSPPPTPLIENSPVVKVISVEVNSFVLCRHGTSVVSEIH